MDLKEDDEPLPDRCDGNHRWPPCNDPNCWQRPWPGYAMNTQDLIALAEKHGAKVTTLGAATDPVFAFNERAMQAFCAALAAAQPMPRLTISEERVAFNRWALTQTDWTPLRRDIAWAAWCARAAQPKGEDVIHSNTPDYSGNPFSKADERGSAEPDHG